jgi:hypothetical protein
VRLGAAVLAASGRGVGAVWVERGEVPRYGRPACGRPSRVL